MFRWRDRVSMMRPLVFSFVSEEHVLDLPTTRNIALKIGRCAPRVNRCQVANLRTHLVSGIV